MRRHPPLALLTGFVLLLAPGLLHAQSRTPSSLTELKEMQTRVQAMLPAAQAATVALRVVGGSGSGVIVSPDGYVLTAGHVSGEPDRPVTIILSDGRKLPGRTLGRNIGLDSGLVKIDAEGPFDFAPMGDSGDLEPGQWLVATGHPGGWREDRPPVVRLGRMLRNTSSIVETDNALVGGDSGGPLFDLRGRVVGIHSRIGPDIIHNLHVPVDRYRQDWPRLLAGESFGARARPPRGPMLGILVEDDPRGARVAAVLENTPADRAGVRDGDVIIRYANRAIPDSQALLDALAESRAGDVVVIDLLRDGRPVTVRATLAARQRMERS